MKNAENVVPEPTALARIESLLEKVVGALGMAQPVISMIPGAAPVAAVITGVATVADEVLRQVDGDPTNDTVDAAALAAGKIAQSTGNPLLDQRLAMIESLVVAAVPIIKEIAKHLSVDTSSLVIDAAA